MGEKEILQAIKDNNLYGFIANNYNQISKEKLKDLILELDFIITEEFDIKNTELNNTLIEYLTEYKGWGE